MQQQGRYIILKEIASGGTATVFLAEDTVLRRKVALKKLHPHLVNQAETVKRFEKEAVAVASLSHGNVIKVYDFGREENGLFLAMEYVDGISLERLLQDTPEGLPSLVALTVFHQLLEGLAAAHGRGICHRDIKPSNVLVDRKGRICIADFGIAFLSEETSITKTGFYLGTPSYCAPEQALGKTVSAKADIFSAGTLFYRALTGRLPFQAETPHAVIMAILEKTPPKAGLANPRILPGLSELVQKMHAKLPDDRPDASSCALELERIAMESGFALQPARIGRLLEEAGGYREAERREVSQSLGRRARLAEKNGRTRETVKLFALAQIFSDPGSEIHRDASVFLRDRKAKVRKRRILLTAPFVFCLVGSLVFLAMKNREGRGPQEELARSPKPAFLHVPAGLESMAQPPADTPVRLDPSLLPLQPYGVEPPAPAKAPADSGSVKRNVRAARKSGSPAITAVQAPGPQEPRNAPEPAQRARDGYLWIKTNPPFAKIKVDGREVGVTPLNSPIAVAEGGRKLELERKGCQTVQADIQVIGGDTASLRFTLNKEEAGP